MMEHDMREKAKNAMRLILEAARFEVEEVDEPLDLSAVREGTCLLVLCSNDRELIGQFDKTNYSLMVNDHEMTCKKLLFTLDKEIITENCIQWGIDEFVRYSGEAVLADIVDRELALDLSPVKRQKKSTATDIRGYWQPPCRRMNIPVLPSPISRSKSRSRLRCAPVGSRVQQNSDSSLITFSIIRVVASRYTKTGGFPLMQTAGVRSMQSTE